MAFSVLLLFAFRQKICVHSKGWLPSIAMDQRKRKEYRTKRVALRLYVPLARELGWRCTARMQVPIMTPKMRILQDFYGFRRFSKNLVASRRHSLIVLIPSYS